MYPIQNLTTDSRQQQTLVLPDGSFMEIEIYFVSLQFGWFITSLTYQDFELNNLRITNSPNMLYQWRNLIPFGLACFSAGNVEPMQVQVFAEGISQLFVLTPDEVTYYTDYLSGQV